jgi:hypothetical protein
VLEWMNGNWSLITVPVIVFLAFCIIAIWARKILYDRLKIWFTKIGWESRSVILETFRTPFLHWFLLLGAYVAILISALSPEGTDIAGKVLASLFIVSLGWTILSIAEKLIRIYINRLKIPPLSIKLIVSIVRIVILSVSLLMIIDVWGAPVTALLLLIGALILIAVVASRDTLLNMFAGLQLAAGDTIKTGDYIKLESDDEGYVIQISWRNTIIKTLDDKLVLVPNSKLVQSTVINYGHPLKKASQPFHFYTRLHLKELTGLKASSLSQLLSILEKAPDAAIYYHTHHFLEEFKYLEPEPANDFALWADDALGDAVLAEKLASIDTFQFSTINSLKKRITEVITEYLASRPDEHKAPQGNEFHIIKSISIVLPTPYLAHDLREFVEVLRKVTIYSIYYHVFEARLRLQTGNNDFSAWFRDSLEEHDLADKIADIDPYTCSLDSLRTMIIQQIEKRIK